MGVVAQLCVRAACRKIEHKQHPFRISLFGMTNIATGRGGMGLEDH
jgi:hypothetical protein